MNDVALAYFAGFFDGEGCITVHRQPNRVYAFVTCTNTDKQVILRFQEAFGGHIQTKVNVPGRVIYVWNISAKKDVVNFLEQIFPFLQVKQQRAILALSMADQPHTWKSISPDLAQFQQMAAAEIQKMNHNGEPL